MSTQDPLNLLSVENLAYPYPVYEQLQNEAPVYWLEPAQAWVCTRYVDVKRLAYDPNVRALKDLKPVGEYSVNEHREKIKKVNDFYNGWLLMKDPPEHTKLRNVFNRGFKPTIMNNLKADVQHLVDNILKDIEEQEQISFMNTVARRLPVQIIALLLGIPRSDVPMLEKWAYNFADFVADQTPEFTAITAETYEIIGEIQTYLQTLINERRRNPQGDLLSAMVEKAADGQEIDDEVLIANCMLLLVGAQENTQNLIGMGLLALLDNPHEFAKLRANPALLPSAVEEMLRYYTPGLANFRILKDDMELSGQLVKGGERVMLMFGAANRDARQFDEPHKFDIMRNPNPHIGLGHGIHFCLGAPLARLELEVTYATLLQRWRNVELVLDKPDWVPNLLFQFMDKFPVKVEWAS